MADYTIPEPEPKEIDERLALELSHLVDNQVLRGHPSGDERCEHCLYYLEPHKDLSYCWHPKLRILVGDHWWCQWWEAIPRAIVAGRLATCRGEALELGAWEVATAAVARPFRQSLSKWPPES